MGRNAHTARQAGGPINVQHAAFVRYRSKLKAEVIAAYGGHCACCGETESDFLSTDHVDDDGQAHRATVMKGRSAGHNQWRHLRRQGYPPVVQLLCFNCHSAKTFYGECPHRRKAQ